MDKFSKPGVKTPSFSSGMVKEETAEVRVLKIDTATTPVIQSFDAQRLAKAGDGDYAWKKARYGALAATDADRAAKNRKDGRFSLNSLLRDPLSIEEEERRVIEEKVQARVSAVADEAKAEAVKLGYAEGLKKGYDEAFLKFQDEAKDRLVKFDEFLNACESAKVEIYKANERYLIELIFRIGKMVTLKELSTDRDYVARLAMELIERVGVRENIKLKVNPGDLETAGILKENLEKATNGMKNLEIEPSNQIRVGGCSVETEWNAIDASVETQLQGLYQALVGKSQS